jgi:glucose dehydrogenase
VAWDPIAQKAAWEVKEPFSVWSGPLATAGGVVFYGTMDGYFKAVDAKTGTELYKFKTPRASSAMSAPTAMAASNMSRCSRVLADGPPSAWPPG